MTSQQIQYGRRMPYSKSFISISQPRFIRFPWHLVRGCKFWFQEWSHDKGSKLWNSKWGTAAILKIVFGHISAIYHATNTKFPTKKQNYADTGHVTKISNLVNSRWQTAATLKMVLPLYLRRGGGYREQLRRSISHPFLPLSLYSSASSFSPCPYLHSAAPLPSVWGSAVSSPSGSGQSPAAAS